MAVQGTFVTSYTGVNATNPPQFVLYKRAPTIHDFYNFNLGTIWVHQKQVPGTPPTYNTSTMYILVALANNIATWVKIGGSGPVGTDAINIIQFGTPGTFTYTPTPGMVQCVVEVLGGGGGSAGSNGNEMYDYTGPGAAGGYAKSIFSAATIGIGQPLTVGIAGTAGDITPTAGGDGGTSSFGTGPILMTCAGGGGSGLTPPYVAGPEYYYLQGGVGGIATGGNLLNLRGEVGIASQYAQQPSLQGFVGFIIGSGGNSQYGVGGYQFPGDSLPGGDAANGIGYGSGASGSGALPGFPTASGGTGGPGLVQISEYF